MLIIPAIDLLGGKVVRLKKGDMDKFTVYSDNPLKTAEKFQLMGVKRLHIVDLDGAKQGKSVNFDIIKNIVRYTDMEIEVGGGIRNHERASAYFELGINYIILGTVAVKNPGLTKSMASDFPDKIILGLDARNGILSSEGWYENSKLSVEELLDEYSEYPFNSVIYTDILRDGMLQGINYDLTRRVAENSPFGVIASGGFKSNADIFQLKKLKNVIGCIVGRAYYEGLVDIKTLVKEEY